MVASAQTAPGSWPTRGWPESMYNSGATQLFSYLLKKRTGEEADD